MHSISSLRPVNAPGQWWHLVGEATVDDVSIDVALTFSDRCKVDGRDHVNASYYLDAATNINHLLVKEGVLPRGLLYVELRSKFLVFVGPNAPVRMRADFKKEGNRWLFAAVFFSGETLVATISGTAAKRPESATPL